MPRESNTAVDNLVEKIRPILAGHDPDIQGAAIADLLAMYVAGHTKEDGVRAEVFAEWLSLVRDLVDMYDKIRQKKFQKK